MAHSKPTLILAILFLNVACTTAHTPIRRASVSAQGAIEMQSDSSSELANMLSDDPEAPAVAKGLLALAREGAPQDELLDLVRNLKSKIEPWHENATKVIERSIESFKQCAVPMTGAMGKLEGKKKECSANAEEESLIQVEALPQTINCRTEQSTKFTTMKKWEAQTGEKKEIMDTECEHFAGIEAEVRAATAHYGGGDAGAYLKSVLSEFCECPDGLLCRYKEAKKKCKDAKDEHTDAKGKWVIAVDEHTEVKKRCNGAQKKRDEGCCKYALETKRTCEAHDQCHRDKVEAYEKVKELFKEEEKMRKVEWRVYSRIECLLPILGTSDTKNIDKCRNIVEHDTTHLTLKYPDPPAKSPCVVEVAYPGTPAYYNAHYGSLPGNAQAQDVLPCTGMEEEAESQFSCVWQGGDGVGGTEEKLGSAANEAACIEMVKTQRPSANGATLESKGSGSCYAEMGMTGVSSSSTLWITCPFKMCKAKSTSTGDAGYADNYRGWYDVQGCGTCLDYCRWVGNSGSGGNPQQKLQHGSSWWSCRLAGDSSTYSGQNHFSSWSHNKCSGEGAAAP